MGLNMIYHNLKKMFIFGYRDWENIIYDIHFNL